MKKQYSLTAILGLMIILFPSKLLAVDFFDDADRFFMAYAPQGGVLYEELADDPQVLNALVGDLASFELDAQSEAMQKAFYINAYNILMIKTVVDHYPVNSPLDINGVFSEIKHDVAGKSLTLDQIEKEILMKKHFDPRLHFVLVCGAKGCPPLADFAYRAENLEMQLNDQTEKALRNPDFVRLDDKGENVGLSHIFKWYKQDFLKEHESLIAYVNEYRKSDIPQDYKVEYYDYDWSLNLKKKVK